MKIQQIFFKNSLRNFSYLIIFNDGPIYCIDPFQSKDIFQALESQKLTAIINTHDHCDHYSGNLALVEFFQCLVMAHPNAEVPLKNKNLNHNEIIFQQDEGTDSWRLRALFTPGHTQSHLCLLLEKNDKAYAVFTGDCFFNAGVGNCHHGGDPAILYTTIKEIFNLFPDEMLIYPGHEYLKRNLEFSHKYEPQNIEVLQFLQRIEKMNLDESFFINTMKIEREINTFLRLNSSELLEHLNLVDAGPKQVFLTLRELRNHW